jgi:dTDP-4-amino-4,6-dideoxygalactose transaminase
MVTTNDKALWSAMWSFKDHGKNWDAIYHREHAPGFRWVHDSFGTNWRMLEVQAVLGEIQLRHMSAWTQRRTEIALRLADALSRHEQVVRVPTPAANLRHAYYRQYGYVRSDGLHPDWSRDRIVAELNTAGVQVLHGTCSEVYLEKAFDGTSYRPETRLPVAKALGETSLMFLTHPTIGDAELDRAVEAIDTIMSNATR